MLKLVLRSLPLRVSVRKYTPRRALMYVPGNDLKKIDKALGLEVDCVTLDCEDGVALNKKAEAREMIRNVLEQKLHKSPKYHDLGVRVNSVESQFCQEDLQTILSSSVLPNTILLPKVESKEHIEWFVGVVEQYLQNARINLIIYIESAKGFFNLREICDTSMKVFSKNQIILTSLVFGSDDFCASIGVVRSEDSSEILYARQKLVLMAKVFNLQAIDMVYIKYKDLAGLRDQCIQGMKMGYTGKQVIHPSQIEVVQETFLPTKAQMDWAHGLLESFKKHQSIGKGAFGYQGSMIDMPTMKQAEHIMKLANIKNKQ